MNALLALRPCKAFVRSTSGIHARPRKRGGGTADIIFWLAVQYSDSPTFTILKLFRAVTVGIVNASEAFMLALLSISIPLAPTNPSKTALSLENCQHPCHMNALLVSQYFCQTLSPLPLNERFVGFASMQSLCAFNFGHPCPPSKKGWWHG